MLTKQGLVGQSGPRSVGLGPAEKRRALVNFKCKVTEGDGMVEFSIHAWATSRTASCAGWTPEHGSWRVPEIETRRPLRIPYTASAEGNLAESIRIINVVGGRLRARHQGLLWEEGRKWAWAEGEVGLQALSRGLG